MPEYIFNLQIDTNTILKISIWRELVENALAYYARYININLAAYQNLSQLEKDGSFGITYRQENNGPIIYYRDMQQFIIDLRVALITGPRLTSIL